MSVQEKQSVSVTVDKEIALRIKHFRSVINDSTAFREDIQNAVLGVLVSHEQKNRIEPDSWRHSRICPKCNNGQLVLRKGARGLFLGCSDFPTCRHSMSHEGDTKAKGK